ncbi:hypothetical protein ACQCSU_08115 [Pseudarthrobacter sp. O4]|uniref:hypothetical protein n=1 Tax=Pseudarthrobacter sp. O4 TaxID=3418417 RepID=UPI003CEBE32E
MALVSMDNGNPPKYFAGRDDLAAALGKGLPDKPLDDDVSAAAEAARKARASTYEVIRKAVAKLVQQGVVVSSGDARFRTRAEYSLYLTPAHLPQQIVAPVGDLPPAQAQQIVAPLPQQIVAPLPQQIVGTAPTDRCPLGVQEQPEEQLLGNGPTSKATLETQMADDFEVWYAIYPKRKARGAAEAAYAKARKNGAGIEELNEGAERYAAERKGKEAQYTKAPATWLNQKCWEDEPEPPKQQLGPWDPAYHKPTVPGWCN